MQPYTLNILTSITMCNDEEGDYVVTCKCSQYDYDDGNDSQYIATLLMEETTEELQANKIDRLYSFLSDVRKYGIKKKDQRDVLYISIVITLLVIILISIFFWKYHHNINGIVAISLYGNGQVQIG